MYVPLVYKTSGGDVLVVSTGGVLNIDGGALQISGTAIISSGGALANLNTLTSGPITSTGTIIGVAITAGGTLTMSSGLVRPVESPATGVANPYTITAYGITNVWSSAANSTAGRRWALPAPSAGAEKWVICLKSTATVPAMLTATGSTSLIDGATSVYIFSTGATNVQWVHLLGENSTNWITLSRSTDILISTT